MTRIVILQPSYLPWLGAFEQIARADVFVFYDDVAFDKHGWRNRNRIKTASGPQWLTVPVLTTGHTGQSILETRIDGRVPWARKHIAALRTHYSRAPHLEWTLDLLAPLLQRRWDFLADLAVESTQSIARAMELTPRWERSSRLGIAGGQTERLVSICRHFGATDYYSGAAARNYLDLAQFDAADIAVEFQDFHHPEYAQPHEAFVAHLSVIDALANLGPAAGQLLKPILAR